MLLLNIRLIAKQYSALSDACSRNVNLRLLLSFILLFLLVIISSSYFLFIIFSIYLLPLFPLFIYSRSLLFSRLLTFFLVRYAMTKDMRYADPPSKEASQSCSEKIHHYQYLHGIGHRTSHDPSVPLWVCRNPFFFLSTVIPRLTSDSANEFFG